MSFSTITAAQRLDVRDSAIKVYHAAQPFAQTGLAPTDAELAGIAPLLTEAATALQAGCNQLC